MKFVEILQSLQHIFHIITMLIFIPIIILIFLPRQPSLNTEELQTYNLLYQQSKRSFIIGPKQQCIDNNYLSTPWLIEVCLIRCQNSCGVSLSNSSLNVFSYQYKNRTYYSLKPILNQIKDNKTMIQNATRLPLDNSTNFYYYIPSQRFKCQEILQNIGQSPSQRFSKLYLTYIYSGKVLFYVNIPIIIIYLLVFILRTYKIKKSDTSSRSKDGYVKDFRNETAWIFIIININNISIIILTTTYKLDTNLIVYFISILGQCLADDRGISLTNYANNDPLSIGFVYFTIGLIFVIAIMFLLFLGLRIIQWKFTVSKRGQQQYQLHDM